MNEWIKTSEELPEFDEPVLVAHKSANLVWIKDVGEMEYIDRMGGQFKRNGSTTLFHPERWMPLPEICDED